MLFSRATYCYCFFFSHSLDECGTFEVSCHVAGLAPYPRPEVDGLFLFLSLFSVLISFLFSLFLCDCGYCHCNCFFGLRELIKVAGFNDFITSIAYSNMQFPAWM